jgi:hypothetical protein
MCGQLWVVTARRFVAVEIVVVVVVVVVVSYAGEALDGGVPYCGGLVVEAGRGEREPSPRVLDDGGRPEGRWSCAANRLVVAQGYVVLAEKRRRPAVPKGKAKVGAAHFRP